MSRVISIKRHVRNGTCLDNSTDSLCFTCITDPNFRLKNKPEFSTSFDGYGKMLVFTRAEAWTVIQFLTLNSHQESKFPYLQIITRKRPESLRSWGGEHFYIGTRSMGCALHPGNNGSPSSVTFSGTLNVEQPPGVIMLASDRSYDPNGSVINRIEMFACDFPWENYLKFRKHKRDLERKAYGAVPKVVGAAKPQPVN